MIGNLVNASAISANPTAMPDKAGQALQRSIPAEQRDFGKKFFPLYAVCFSYLLPDAGAHRVQPEVTLALQIQYHRLPGDFLGDHLWRQGNALIQVHITPA